MTSGRSYVLFFRRARSGSGSSRGPRSCAAAEDVAEAISARTVLVSPATLPRTRQRFVKGGLDWAATERKPPGAKRNLGAQQEAFLIAWAGRQEWPRQLLADQVVTREVVGTIASETVRRTLRKNALRPCRKED